MENQRNGSMLFVLLCEHGACSATAMGMVDMEENFVQFGPVSMTQYSHIYSSALQPPRYITLHCNHRAATTALSHPALQPLRCIILRCNHRVASFYAATTALHHSTLQPPRCIILRCNHHAATTTLSHPALQPPHFDHRAVSLCAAIMIHTVFIYVKSICSHSAN